MVQKSIKGGAIQTEISQQVKPVRVSEVGKTVGNELTDSRGVDDRDLVQESEVLKSDVHVLGELHEVLLRDGVDLHHSSRHLLWDCHVKPLQHAVGEGYPVASSVAVERRLPDKSRAERAQQRLPSVFRLADVGPGLVELVRAVGAQLL